MMENHQKSSENIRKQSDGFLICSSSEWAHRFVVLDVQKFIPCGCEIRAKVTDKTLRAQAAHRYQKQHTL
jgi:hypothetical protein